MDIRDDVILVRELLHLTEKELAEELGVAFATVNRWETGQNVISPRHLQDLYAYAYRHGVYLNRIHEQFLKEEHQTAETKVLFHGAKSAFTLPVDLTCSKRHNDFGPGFYLGESFEQAASYIATADAPNVYAFALDLTGLKTVTFPVTLDWMLAISRFRGWMDAYKESPLLQSVTEKVLAADVVIAPIADNRMFDLIAEFVRGEITDLQCEHALSATDLGMQYVVRTEQAVRKLSFLQEMYVCPPEKDDFLQSRLETGKNGQDKVKAARIAYRGKGTYIDELLA